MFDWARSLDDGPTDLGTTRRSGLPWLDRVVGGFMDAELQYWGGAPGSGKTLAMLQSAYWLASHGEPALVLSMELGRKRVAQRLAAIDSRVPGKVIQYGPPALFEEHRGELYRAVSRIAEFPLFGVFGPVATAEVGGYVQAVEVATKRRPVVFVDRLEKWADADLRGQKPLYRIGALSGRTHAIAAQHEVPVVCLVQLNRAGRLAETPTMEAFRDAGDVEQDCQAGVIIRTDKRAGTSVWHVVKQNDGPEGACEEILFDKTIPAFYPVERLQPDRRAS